MKKEQIIKWLTIMKVNLRAFPEISNSKKMQALGEAIKIIEQETVSKESYDHEYFLRKELEIKIDELQHQLKEQAVKTKSILDKVRAEIKNDWQLKKSPCSPFSCGLRQAIVIIDKYREEVNHMVSEDKDV